MYEVPLPPGGGVPRSSWNPNPEDVQRDQDTNWHSLRLPPPTITQGREAAKQSNKPPKQSNNPPPTARLQTVTHHNLNPASHLVPCTQLNKIRIIICKWKPAYSPKVPF